VGRTHPPGQAPPAAAIPAGGDRRSRPAHPEAASAASDAELVALAKRDRQQFVHLYRRYRDPVHRFCHALLGDREAAEDAASATFLKALEKIGGCRDGADVKAWLFAVARNVVHDDYRSRRPAVPWDQAAGVEDRAPSPEELAIAGDERVQIWTLLRQLKPDERDLIALRLEGLNDKQIAQIVNRSHGTIRNKQAKTLGRLKALLGVATRKEAPDAER
jgi:RNA polymerase sigma-70 factor (ECF subfamily)